MSSSFFFEYHAPTCYLLSKSLEFLPVKIDLAYLFQFFFNFGTFNVAQPHSERHSWLNRWLHGEHSAFFECEVHNLELKAAPPFPKQKETQPGMVHFLQVILLTSYSSAF